MIPGDPWGAPWGAPWGSVGDPWEVSGESLWVPWEIPEDSLWCPWEGPGDPGAVGLSGLGEGGWGVNPWGLVASGFPTWTNKDHRKHMPQIVSKRFQNELPHPTPPLHTHPPSPYPLPPRPLATARRSMPLFGRYQPKLDPKQDQKINQNSSRLLHITSSTRFVWLTPRPSFCDFRCYM